MSRTGKYGLAVVDTDGIKPSVIQSAVRRDVFVYGYLNAGALEKGRSYYDAYSSLRIAPYEGWDGEYWVDVTAPAWKAHLCDTAEQIGKIGAIGLYFDNADIYGMCRQGFGGKAFRKAPAAADAYKALAEVVNTIQDDMGLIVMPNGGDEFVKKFMRQYPKRIKTINQEGVLYEDFHSQPKKERLYRTEWCDWAKDHGAYIRIIEYPVEDPKSVKSKALYAVRARKCKDYCKKHGWQGLYISKHTDLWGD